MAPPQAAAAPPSAPLVGPLGSTDAAQLRRALVAVMSIPACPYCKRAKEALAGEGIPFVDVNVGADAALRQQVRDATGKRTVPQIFLAGSSVGGCDDLLAQLQDGSFKKALAEAQASAAAAVAADLLAEIEAAQQRAEAELTAQRAEAGPSGGGAAEQQQLEALAARLRLPELQGGIPRIARTITSRTFRSFTLRQLLEWLSAAGEPDPRVTAGRLLATNAIAPATLDRDEAERVAAAVTRGSAPTARSSSSSSSCGGEDEALLLMLTSEAPAPLQGEALNVQFVWHGPARPANEVAGSLRNLILELYDKHLSSDGRSVSYGAMRSDPLFAAFVGATAELQMVDLSPLSREELIAFAVNLYNALVIHALVALGLTRMTAAQRASFYSRTAKYNIGGLDYTADDLENGVLRGNRAGAANLFNLVGLHGLSGGHWRRGDSRLAKVVSPPDPRIHFALVCGAKSCPPIKLYTPSNLEEGLAAAAEAFCATEVQVDTARREVKLSKILQWYAIDFGRNKYERLSYISNFLTEPAKGELLGLVASATSGGGDVRVTYNEYDWGLNGTD